MQSEAGAGRIADRRLSWDGMGWDGMGMGYGVWGIRQVSN